MIRICKSNCSFSCRLNKIFKSRHHSENIMFYKLKLPEFLLIKSFDFSLHFIKPESALKTYLGIVSMSMLSHMISDNFRDCIWDSFLSFFDHPLSCLICPFSLWVKKNLSPLFRFLNCSAKMHANVAPTTPLLTESFKELPRILVKSWRWGC